MHLNRQTWIQLIVFSTISVVALTYMLVEYIDIPKMIFGAGQYRVTVQLPESAGLYTRANVTYEGTPVGQVDDVRLTKTGVEADLSLKSGIDIPSELDAQVHSQSAVGEQYVALLPRNASAPPLRDGDVIPQQNVSVPKNINKLLDATNTALQAIPRDNLKTVVDETYTAVGGLGPEISRLIKGSTTLANDADQNLGPLTTLIDQVQPVLDSQTNTSDAVAAWAANLANVTGQLKSNDSALASVIDHGGPAAGEVQKLLDRLSPTLPIILANLVSVGDIALVYRANLEQILVMLPQTVRIVQGASTADRNLPPGPHKGGFLSFNLNVNLPPPCTTGYLPSQQRRPPSDVDFPDRPTGDLYCRIPQDSPLNVRGIRNIPCETKPWKRAPTVEICESDQDYVPLNNGDNWKGDSNATLSGQDIPEMSSSDVPSAAPPQPPPIAVAQYDPATGAYIGPDGKADTQADLAQNTKQGQTWQSMLLPPPGS